MKYKVIIVFFAFLSFLFTCIVPAYADMSAYDIIKKCDNIMRGKTTIMISDMIVVTPSWIRTISMQSWSQGTEKTFIHITAPAREKDTTFLKDGNLLYQYLPSAEMRIKITPSMMLQSWMGSDFTNDDLVKESSIVDDYMQLMLARETAGGKDCYKIQLNPKPEAAIVWDKVIIWVDSSNFLPVKEEYYNEKGEKVRYMVFSNVQQANDRLFPFKWTMIPLNKTGHSTSLVIKSIRFNVPIEPSVFSLKNLEKPR